MRCMGCGSIGNQALDELERGFPEFLANVKEGDLKVEYLLPMVVDQCIRRSCFNY